ncbi:MAG: hypothetical protein QM765_29690 [Myxococcales bacterium]
MPMLLLLLAGLAAAPTAPKPDALKLFRAGKYDEACPLFRKVAEAKPTNGAAWSDLGLCEFKRGHREEGRAATLRAIRFGDATTRAHAAYNWATYIGVHDIKGTWCEPPKAEPLLGCERTAHVCQTQSDVGGGGSQPAFLEQVAQTVVAADEARGKLAPALTNHMSPGAIAPVAGKPPPYQTVRAFWNYCGDPWECLTVEESYCELILVDPCAGRLWVRCSETYDPRKGDPPPPGPVEERAFSVK